MTTVGEDYNGIGSLSETCGDDAKTTVGVCLVDAFHLLSVFEDSQVDASAGVASCRGGPGVGGVAEGYLFKMGDVEIDFEFTRIRRRYNVIDDGFLTGRQTYCY